jgi:hypothetical protein
MRFTRRWCWRGADEPRQHRAPRARMETLSARSERPLFDEALNGRFPRCHASLTV